MNAKEKNLIQVAVKQLKLLDILLYESRYSRPTARIKTDGIKTTILEKHKTGYGIEKKEGTPGMLVVKIDLGIRMDKRKEGKQGGDPETIVQIEADFIALYEIKSKVSNVALKTFAKYNGMHNVWPFWRQHVFDIVQRGNLPKINISLFADSTGSK